MTVFENYYVRLAAPSARVPRASAACRTVRADPVSAGSAGADRVSAGLGVLACGCNACGRKHPGWLVFNVALLGLGTYAILHFSLGLI